ncbi:CHAT domain-containing protein [cf. Phormidesmis sp. LEGE 11477]|uniref:CHAT domain-containing protein n=1 Tax=cf. Phormidesmis sp. LEGE 11477 TaxID=1828680 RepID=UPI0018824179|nr:CHAT domain-containing protein [cf. Phormidesmis sp. LEGE 11477]MBE9062251.1 CHAT domain-containing protein [cf. Phormidesmis sp. LEGE 11477]
MRFSRNWLLTLIGFFLAFALSANSSGYAQAYSTADELNQEGFSLLYSGVPAEALSTWRDAERLYREKGDREGTVGTQLNQSLAQQALGLNPVACKTITEALSVTERLCQPQAGREMVVTELAKVSTSPVNTIGIRLLGENLGSLSNLEEAIAALTIAESLTSETSEQRLSTMLALANVYNLSLQQALQDYSRIDKNQVIEQSQQLTQIAETSNKAVSLYQSVGSSSNPQLAEKARLNMIGMFARALEQRSDNRSLEEAWIESLAVSAQLVYEDLGDNGFNQLPAIESIYARLNLANSLMSIKRSEDQWSWGDSIAYDRIELLTTEAIDIAERIDNHRARSSAYGTTGELLAQTGAARSLVSEQYHQALALAQSVRAYDLSYQWAYRLAVLSEQGGEDDTAKQYYRNAISALSDVRNDLLAVNSELRFSFRENVEPVYRDYMRLLASQEVPDLQQVNQVHDSLQLAQLENFLRCGRLAPAVQRADQTTAHIINLGDVIQVVVTQDGRSYGYKGAAADITAAADSLIANTQSVSFVDTPEEEFLPYAQRLYDALLRPAVEAGLLQDNQEITFALDAPFQSIPVGLLHDGQQYLIATHPLSISLQMQRVNPTVSGADVMFAGLSTSAPSFDAVNEVSSLSGDIAPLPETELEAQYLDAYIGTQQALLNQEFTIEGLNDVLTDSGFEIVHISTHGQFSSLPERTFLLAWDEPIDLIDLSRLFQRTEGINLLFLSACQAASGDDRAVLGLAGLAVQSSARSAIAPLWLQDTTGGSTLIDSFYRSLAEGRSSSEALQQAQINLMNSDDFSHPYYWAPFILAAS